jgi:hypothetical protein
MSSEKLQIFCIFCCGGGLLLMLLSTIPIYGITVGMLDKNATCWADETFTPPVWLQSNAWINLIFVIIGIPLVFYTYCSGHGCNGPEHPNIPTPLFSVSALFNLIWFIIGIAGIWGSSCSDDEPRLYTAIAITIAADAVTVIASIFGIVYSTGCFFR